MAAKRRNRTRSPAAGASSARVDSSPSGPSVPRADWLVSSIYAVFLLALFLACSPALDSKFALPKAIVLCAGVFALAMLLFVRAGRGRIVVPPQSILLLTLALGAWWIVSTPFALHLPTALDGEYDYYNGLWTHLCWLALFAASMCLPLDLHTVRTIAALATAAVVPVALVNVAETAGLSSLGLKEVSTLGDRVAASALMNFAIPFVAIALTRPRPWLVKAGLGCVLALLVLSEFLSQGRGPWMGFAAAAVVLALGLVRSKAGWKTAAAILLGIVMLAGLAAKLSPMAAERIATLTRLGHDESLRQRFVLYRAALRATRDHPIAGIGFENFRNSYPSYRSAEDVYFFDNVIPTMVHNGYLQAALTNGVPALLLYLALVAAALVKLLSETSQEVDREKRELALAFLAALVAYLVQDLVGWLDMALSSTFWLMLGLAMNLAHQHAPRSSASWEKPAIAAFSGLIVLLSLYLVYDRYARIVADAQLAQAQALDVDMQWPRTKFLVDQALARLPQDSRTEMVAGQIYAQRFLASHDPSAFARSRELLQSSFIHNRFDRLRLVNIVALESAALESGQIDKASDFAQQAMNALAASDGDNPGFHEFKAKFLAAQGRYREALDAIRQARRLAPQAERLRARELEYQAKLK